MRVVARLSSLTEGAQPQNRQDTRCCIAQPCGLRANKGSEPIVDTPHTTVATIRVNTMLHDLAG